MEERGKPDLYVKFTSTYLGLLEELVRPQTSYSIRQYYYSSLSTERVNPKV